MLITCLDSNPELLKLDDWMQYISSRNWDHEIIGSSIWIPEKSVLEVFSDGKTFYHFDELYLLRNEPLANIDGTHYTTDGVSFAKEIPDTFLDKFAKLNAVRYVSDGCGLNFACESPEIVNKIERLEQIISSKK